MHKSHTNCDSVQPSVSTDKMTAPLNEDGLKGI